MHTVLIADDDITSREIVKSILQEWGYTVLAACDGNQALQVLQTHNDIAVAILDWIMPGLNGLDICARFTDQNDFHTHLMLLSSKGDLQDVITGLDSGAHDYLIKPFKPLELRARINAGIRSYEMKKIIFQYAHSMEQLAAEKAAQLIHADRLSTLGILSAGITHEINNPLGFIQGNIQFLLDCWPTIQPALQQVSNNPEFNETAVAMCLQEFEPSLRGMQNGIARISKIISGLKQYARKDSGEKKETSLKTLLDNAILLTDNKLKNRVTINTPTFNKDYRVYADSQKIEQVFINLLLNAADALESSTNPTITISYTLENQFITIHFTDNGPGIPSNVLGKIFMPFFTTKQPGKGTGLGLAICQSIIEEHNGTITAHNNNAHACGAIFSVSLPCTQYPSK
jgi:two-component system, NtrC family, sensor kinase